MRRTSRLTSGGRLPGQVGGTVRGLEASVRAHALSHRLSPGRLFPSGVTGPPSPPLPLAESITLPNAM